MNTVKINTNSLMPPALNYLVAKCEGEVWATWRFMDAYSDDKEGRYHYPTDWAQGGPIIEREGLTLTHQTDKWAAQTDCDLFSYGPTPLIAAMRCYVASKLGEIVEVPRELYKED